MKGRARRLSLVLAVGMLVAAGLVAGATTGQSSAEPQGAAAAGCHLSSAKGDIKHVIYLQFDNTHFLRDNPNVPSDLEQMPHLLNFLRGNGTLFTNDHTMLISHTGGGILSTLTGLYPDRHGQAVSNSYRYFKADGTTASSSSFKYWTDLVDDVGIPPADPTPNMVNGDSGTPKTTPAPWVPYTRAGCDFGAAAVANVVSGEHGHRPERRHDEGVRPGFCPSGTRPRPPTPRRRAPRHGRSPRPTSSGSLCTAPLVAASVPATRTPGPICCRTSRAATSGSTGCSGRSTSTRRSPVAAPP